MQTLHMGLGENFGDLLTNAYRSKAWYTASFDIAADEMLKDMPDIPEDVVINILNGKMKFETCEDNVTIHVVDDEWMPPNWKVITETLIKVTQDSFSRTTYFLKLGIKSYQSELLLEYAEEAYEYLYDNKAKCHELYNKFLDEILKIKKTINNDTIFSLTEHPMFVDVVPHICTDITGVKNGWLSPNGILYDCLHFQHDNLAYELHEKGGAHLENTNWIRLVEGEWLSLTKLGFVQATEKQMDFIEKWQKTNSEGNYFRWCHDRFTYEDWLNKQVSPNNL